MNSLVDLCHSSVAATFHINLQKAELATFRTKICEKHRAGTCISADRCAFSHCQTWQRRNPNEYSYSCRLCPEIEFVKKGNKMSLIRRCSRGRGCMFAHSKEEELYHPDLYKTKMCNSRPTCTRYYCPFAHNKDELRRLTSSTSKFTATSEINNATLNPPYLSSDDCFAFLKQLGSSSPLSASTLASSAPTSPSSGPFLAGQMINVFDPMHLLSQNNSEHALDCVTSSDRNFCPLIVDSSLNFESYDNNTSSASWNREQRNNHKDLLSPEETHLYNGYLNDLLQENFFGKNEKAFQEIKSAGVGAITTELIRSIYQNEFRDSDSLLKLSNSFNGETEFEATYQQPNSKQSLLDQQNLYRKINLNRGGCFQSNHNAAVNGQAFRSHTNHDGNYEWNCERNHHDAFLSDETSSNYLSSPSTAVSYSPITALTEHLEDCMCQTNRCHYNANSNSMEVCICDEVCCNCSRSSNNNRVSSVNGIHQKSLPPVSYENETDKASLLSELSLTLDKKNESAEGCSNWSNNHDSDAITILVEDVLRNFLTPPSLH